MHVYVFRPTFLKCLGARLNVFANVLSVLANVFKCLGARLNVLANVCRCLGARLGVSAHVYVHV